MTYKNLTVVSWLLVAATIPYSASAQQYVFRSIDVPGAASTYVGANNNGGAMVGAYAPGGLSSANAGFLLSRGAFTPVNYPGALSTTPNGISGNGKVVGAYEDSSSKIHGFLLVGKTYSTVDCPTTVCTGAVFTALLTVNNSGAMVGYYWDGSAYHGIKVQGGVFTVIDPPGAVASIANTINNSGQIVGYYSTTDPSLNSGLQGYMLSSGSYTPINYPGAASTIAEGLNNVGQIDGAYIDTSGMFHGFTDVNGVFSTLDYPGSTETEAFEINDSGQIVGVWFSGASGYDEHGFLASLIPGSQDASRGKALRGKLAGLDK